MKQPYEKPKMVTEAMDIGLLTAGGSLGLVSQLQPWFHLCPQCG